MKKVKIQFSLDEYNKGGYEVETDVAGYHITILKTDAKGNEPIIVLCLIDEYEVPLAFNKKGEISNNSLNLVLVKYDFEEGDIVFTKNRCTSIISILKNIDEEERLINYYADIFNYDYGEGTIRFNNWCDSENIRLATDEEKKRLFDALAKNGKRWNAETKQIESIEYGKETNWVSSGIISTNEVIFRKEENGLRRGCFVLARDGKDQSWELDIFGRHDNEYTGGYTCVGGCYDYCIPFDSETEHLHGTTEDCPSKYKAWKD